MLNSWNGQGRLGNDVELKYVTGENIACASFSIACDRNYKPKDGERQCDWIEIVAWRGLAEFAAKFFHKGDMMIVSGRLETRTYDDKNGIRRKSTKVIASEISFGGNSNSSGNNNSPRNNSSGNEYAGGNSGYNSNDNGDYGGYDGFMNIPDGIDEELPFMGN